MPASDDPRGCPACAVVRWLDTLGVAEGLGRGSARMHLHAAQPPTPASPHSHTITGPPRWRQAAQLLPAIDRHGWIEDYRPLSTRSITTRLALAASRYPSAGPSRADPPQEIVPSQPPPGATPSLEEVLALLDQVVEDADALNNRIKAPLAEGTCAVHPPSGGTTSDTDR